MAVIRRVLFLYLYLLYLSCSSQLDAVCSGYCQNHPNRSDHLNFVDPIPSLDPYFIHSGSELAVKCCATGYIEIAWQRFNLTDRKWHSFPWFPDCQYCEEPRRVEMCDQNQTLKAERAYREDNATYRCTVESESGHKINRTINVIVTSCNNDNEDSVFSNKPEPHQTSQIGGNLTLLCEGIFQYPDAAARTQSATWWKSQKDGKRHHLFQNTSRHFQLSSYKQMEHCIIGSRLEIISITPDDYGIVFECVLSTKTSRKNFSVQIYPPAKDEVTPRLQIIISCVCVGIVTLILSSLLVAYILYKPWVDYQLQSWFHPPSPRGNKDYDAMLVHSDDEVSEKFVEKELLPKLKQEKYEVYSQKDCNPGRGEISAMEDAIPRSACCLFVYSSAEVKDPLCQLYLSAIIDHNDIDLVVLELEPIPKEVWEDVEHQHILKHLTKVQPCAKWPGSNCKSKRKMINFWCSLKLKLPSVVDKKERKVSAGRQKTRGSSSVSSSRPLLTHRQISTVNSQIPDTEDIDEEVFRREETTSNSSSASSCFLPVHSADQNVCDCALPKGFIEEDPKNHKKRHEFVRSSAVSDDGQRNRQLQTQKQWSGDSGYFTSPAPLSAELVLSPQFDIPVV